MTLHSTVNDGGKTISIHSTYGPARFTITEDLGHVRSFWAELGRRIEEAEHDAAAVAERLAQGGEA